MSESGHFTSKAVLKDRALRKIEAAQWVSLRPGVAYERILGRMIIHPKAQNYGNSLRQTNIYLGELAKAGFGEFDEDQFKLTEEGQAWLERRMSKLQAWLLPFDAINRDLERLKH